MPKEQLTRKFNQGLVPLLIVPDVHVPYHDKRAWELMLAVGKDLKPQVLVSLGDMMDFYSVSSHSKNPNRVSQLGNRFLIPAQKVPAVGGLWASVRLDVVLFRLASTLRRLQRINADADNVEITARFQLDVP